MHQGHKALPHLGARAGDCGHPVVQHAPCGAGVVEPLRKHQVLEADGHRLPTDHVIDISGTTSPSRTGHGVIRPDGRRRMAGTGPQHLSHRKRPGDDLAGGQPVARLEGVAEAEVYRIHAQGNSQPVHLGFVGEAGLDGAEAPHGPTRWVVGTYHHALDLDRRHAVGPNGEASGIGDHRTTGRGIGPTVQQEAGLDPDQVSLRGG